MPNRPQPSGITPPPADPDPPSGGGIRLFQVLPWFVLLIGLATTYALSEAARREARTELDTEFAYRADEIVDNLQARMRGYEQVLRGVSGLFAASQSVERREFRDFIGKLEVAERFPGIQGVGFALLVPPSDKTGHIAKVRSEGFPTYDITPGGERDSYTSIVFLEPFDWRNQRAFGYDMYSEGVRRAAMARARDQNATAVSAKVKLLQETDRDVQAGFLMYFPVYRNGLPHETLAQRRASLLGWAYAPFRVNDLMEGLLRKQFGDIGETFELKIFDGSAGSTDALMYRSPTVVRNHNSLLQVIRKVDVGGHGWTLVISSLPGFEAGRDAKKHRFILSTGGAVSVLLALIVWLLANGRIRALALAGKMTRDLKQSLQEIEDLYDNAPCGYHSLGPDGVILRVNKTEADWLGYSREELVGRPLQEILSAGSLSMFHDIYPRFKQRGWVEDLEMQLVRKDGSLLPVLVNATVVSDSQGNFLMSRSTLHDMRKRLEIENALRRSETFLGEAQRIAHLGSWEWDIYGKQIFGSREFYRILGHDQPQVLDFPGFTSYVHRSDRDMVEKTVEAALAGEITYSVDFRIVKADGVERVVHSEGEIERNPNGRAVRMFGTLQDITERSRDEAELRVSKEQLRELSSHLQTVREQEKALIAREIHDELGGNLTALKMDVYWLSHKLPKEMEAARDKVEDMANIVDGSIQSVRRIVTELRPTVLDDLGLVAAMKWQASEFFKRFGIRCTMTLHGEEIPMSDSYRIALFRIFQEALTNVARYSRATLVQADMWLEHDKIALEIADNGIGIPEGTIMDPMSHGIRGMVERARSLKGAVEIGSAPGEGVVISVRIPLPVSDEAAP